jgi:hypothetical protein
MLKRTWALLQHWQIVKRIEEVLLVSVAAGMAGNHLVSIGHINPKGISLDRQLRLNLVGGYRIAIGLKLD